MYITEDEFMSDYYNEIFATVDGAKELDTYGTEYKDLVKETADRIDDISQNRIDERKDAILSMYDEAVVEAKETAKAAIYQHVVESLTEQYSNYFIGMDVSAIIEPYIQPAYEKALESYDLRKILNLNMVTATTGNGMSLQDRNSILLKIMNPVQTE